MNTNLDQDFSKVDRYAMQSSEEDGRTYRDIGRCSWGNFVLHSDYTKLLESKNPTRQASFKNVITELEKKIKEMEIEAFSRFERKDEINYGYAVQTYERARQFKILIGFLEKL